MLMRGDELTAEKAFTTIIIFNIIEFPIRVIPESVGELTRTWQSLKRLGSFLYSEEINHEYIRYEPEASEDAICVRDGTFYWEIEDDKPAEIISTAVIDESGGASERNLTLS